MEKDLSKAEEAIKQFLKAMGQDLEREGLKDTPKRFVKFMNEFLTPPEFNMTTFSSEQYDEMIIVKDIPFFSLCEHHMAVIQGVAAVAYIPGDEKKIVGLSKIPRTVEMFSRRLQNQERITHQVAEYLNEHLRAKGVACILQARHACMEMRGVKKTGAVTTTSCMLGIFKEDVGAKAEFTRLIKPWEAS